MPELPEVETTLRSIKPHLLKQKISAIIIKQPKLRWKIPQQFSAKVKNQTVLNIQRRGKYLLIQLTKGWIIIHLGMSGKLCICPHEHQLQKHEHVNLILQSGLSLCYIDPRRFGAILWTDQDPLQHKLLKSLGPEPLTPEFNGTYLYNQAQKHKCSVKQFIMNNQVVVGVGNIYANEALFLANIRPDKKANLISKESYILLAKNIKAILTKAIKLRGTTIKDFASNGKPGSFQQLLNVYGRAFQPCKQCGTLLEEKRIGQRNTVFCPNCQK